jgi:hypothetical protein
LAPNGSPKYMVGKESKLQNKRFDKPIVYN